MQDAFPCIVVLNQSYFYYKHYFFLLRSVMRVIPDVLGHLTCPYTKKKDLLHQPEAAQCKRLVHLE